MPYYIAKDHEGCKSGWAVVGDTDVVHGCHSTKASAIKQAVAISLATDEPFKGERSTEVVAVTDIAVGDYVKWEKIDGEDKFGEVYEFQGLLALVKIYDEESDVWWETSDMAAVLTSDLTKIPPLTLASEAEPAEPSAMRSKWLRSAWAIKARLEGLPEERAIGKNEIRTNHIELRAEGDGRSFSGYASVFNEPSLPLPFTEIVKPGAFKRSLQSRNRMMLLWNHDTSNPLASTRNGSLQLSEDARGLKVTATLPDTTLGRDIAELVRTGVVDSMSFGFSVKRDSWSQDGQTRYLEDVSLYEVSLVSTPAYEATAGTVSVRSGDSISADTLAEALFKVENGEELDAAEGAVVADVISRLTKTEAVQEVDGDILALKQKKLALLMMGI